MLQYGLLLLVATMMVLMKNLKIANNFSYHFVTIYTFFKNPVCHFLNSFSNPMNHLINTRDVKKKKTAFTNTCSTLKKYQTRKSFKHEMIDYTSINNTWCKQMYWKYLIWVQIQKK